MNGVDGLSRNGFAGLIDNSSPSARLPDGCDDGDDATLDICQDGICVHHQPVSCGTGTALNPMTGECEPMIPDPECVDGTFRCQQYSATRLLAYAVCMGGQWFPFDNCGQIGGTMVCVDGIGCVETN